MSLSDLNLGAFRGRIGDRLVFERGTIHHCPHARPEWGDIVNVGVLDEEAGNAADYLATDRGWLAALAELRVVPPVQPRQAEPLAVADAPGVLGVDPATVRRLIERLLAADAPLSLLPTNVGTREQAYWRWIDADDMRAWYARATAWRAEQRRAPASVKRPRRKRARGGGLGPLADYE